MIALPIQMTDTTALLRHECRLFWRDTVSLMTARGRWRIQSVAIVAFLLCLGLHAIAWAVLHARLNEPLVLDRDLLIGLSSIIVLTFCMMLSQALESVTRLFYARGDLDLILTSPMPAKRMFLPRLIAVSGGCWMTTLPVAAPFIHVLAWADGWTWLGAHLFVMALAGLATIMATWTGFGLFHLFGPSRTRAIAQISAALIGAVFIIGLQLAAILQSSSLSRMAYMFEHLAPLWPVDLFHPIWWPAQALSGDLSLLLMLIGILFGLAWLTNRCLGSQFAQVVLAAQSHNAQRRRDLEIASADAIDQAFSNRGVASVLRIKEWRLLIRDPWLISQSLMQILYLLPPAVLLYMHFGANENASSGMGLGIAVLVMAMGQLAGGLAWLALSGEDARELLITAPTANNSMVWAKVQAVLVPIGCVSAPIILAMAWLAIEVAALAAIGVAVASTSTVLIQIWFEGEASRRQFRRRQTTSRVAAFAEALVCIGWAATFAIAVQSMLAASLVAIMPIGLLALTAYLGRSQNPKAKLQTSLALAMPQNR